MVALQRAARIDDIGKEFIENKIISHTFDARARGADNAPRAAL